jgi:hypothetical protein
MTSERFPRKMTISETLAKSRQLDRVLAKGIFMSTKFRDMAERVKALPQRLDDRASQIIARMDSLENRGGAAIEGMTAELDKVEQGVRASEDALNQMTNGGPDLSDSSAEK